MIYVITYNEIEGTHCWSNAPKAIKILRHPHRHVFVIWAKFSVSHSDRDIEIILKQHEIQKWFHDRFGCPADFGEMSCEMIAQEVLDAFDNCVTCEVLEDGRGGAEVQKENA